VTLWKVALQSFSYRKSYLSPLGALSSLPASEVNRDLVKGKAIIVSKVSTDSLHYGITGTQVF